MIIFCSKRCGTLNIKTIKSADTEHDQNMDDESDNASELADHSAQDFTEDDSTHQIASTLASSPVSHNLKKSKMQRYMADVNEIENNEIDALMAEFFTGCNVPLHACESKYFKNFIGALRPSYEIPNRHRLAAILDKAYDKFGKRNAKLTTNSDNQNEEFDSFDNAPNLTCNARIGNLLACDILKSSKYVNVMTNVLTVQKDFRRTPLENRLLAAGGSKAVLYGIAQWASQHDEAESFLENLTFMKKVTADCDIAFQKDKNAARPKPAVSQLLLNANFVDSVKDLVNMLDSVAELIDYCQRSDVLAADLVEKWLDLLGNESQELSKLVDERCTKSNVFSDIAMTANFFHPDYRGKKLNESQRKDVYDYFFDALDAEGLESVRLYMTSDGTFESLEKKEIKSPKTFWHFASQQGHKQLADFAIELLSLKDSAS